MISEFMASNSSGLQDQDGDFSDWVEIHNPDASPVNLDGWFLTDNASLPAKWRFPSTVIPSGGYLVVFASNKNRAVSGQQLHTNFALSAGGEFLGLVAPDGTTVVSSYSPQFPAQSSDVSYGIPSNVTASTLVASNAAARWIIPTSAISPAATWRDPGYADTSWNAATMGIGYDTNTSTVNYLTEIGSGGNTQSGMLNLNQSVYLRIAFPAVTAANVVSLKLRLKYDDGFVAYLNGQSLLSNGTALTRNAPASPVWSSGATNTHDDAAAMIFEEFDVSSSIGQLSSSANVLAFQVLNKGTGSSDLLFKAELVAQTLNPSASTAPGYFAAATPGARNGGSDSLVIPQFVTFSKAEGTFISNFNLTLGGTAAGQVIRYTTNGSAPTSASTLYTAPFTVTTSTLVRARVFDSTTGASGVVTGANYEKLGTTLTSYSTTGAAFRSSLPIMVLNNRGIGEIPNDDTYRDCRLQVFDRDGTGYSNISAAPALNSMTGVKLRGSSSAGFAKKSYSIELRKESLDSRSLALLGMPAGSDWALVSCADFDPSFMRNAWIYEAHRRTGRWSPRTRFVELFFNQNGNDLDYTDYRGIYLLCETVRDEASRVDITPLETADIAQPAISGGYIIKVDRYDADEFNWHTNRSLPPSTTSGNAVVIHRPKTAALASQQSSYVVNYFQTFEDTLFTEAANNFSTRNYRNYIDSATWAEHGLFDIFAKNVDALRLSSYFIKDRGRRIEGGPLWDFDRSANSTDGRDDAYNTWIGTGDATDYFNFAWWQPLFQDVEFRQLFVDRWQSLRAGVLSSSQLSSIIDGFQAEFKITDADNPTTRDYAKWYGSTTAKSFTGEVSTLKTWLTNRAAWIDSQFTSPPVLVTTPGMITSGQTVTMTIPSGTTVYYRLDGLDPRAEGGSVRAGSMVYTGTPVALSATTLLTARAWRSGSYATPATNWSGPVSGLYLVGETYASAANLRVTGIHYNPLGPDASEIAAIPDVSASDFEWIELSNSGSAPINVEGVSLESTKPVSALTLPAFTLAPGARGVLVKRRAAFLLRHPSAASRVIAEWTGDKNLDNNGESILIRDRYGLAIADFAYDDNSSWPARADGDGAALEYLGTTNTTAAYQNGGNWRSSAEVHGSPGVAGTGPRNRVLINEVLASSVLPQVDAIELYNPGGSTIDIGGWYLGNFPSALTVDDYRQYRIPNGTVIQPGARLVFTEAQFNPNGAWNPAPGTAGEGEFSLDGSRGGEVWLISANPATAKFDAFEDHIEFTPASSGVSQGRSPDGAAGIVPLASRTLLDETVLSTPQPGAAAANSAPRIGGVQVSEIMYHPLTGAAEYLEIVNTGAAAESLAQWTLRGDVDYTFGSPFTLAAGESILIVAFDPMVSPATAAAFRAAYQVPAATRLVGPWSAAVTLSDAAGNVRLRRKTSPPADDPVFIGLMMEDEVPYMSSAPWPVTASGTGLAIQRLGVSRQGNDPTAWTAAAPSPGTDSGGAVGWQLEHFPSGGPLTGANDDFDHDGIPNRLEYLLGTDPRSAAGPPWTSFPAAAPGGTDLVLEYRRRRDRTDFPLLPTRSSDLLHWQPVSDDRHVSDDGLYEIRRAHLPIDSARGYLRLESPLAP